MIENEKGKGKPMRQGAEGNWQPPDGGWGWMVVLGSAVSHMILIPILQNFTLIFKGRFVELGFSPTNITTLVSLNASFGMIVGLLNGPLLKIFGYRKVALVGLTVYEIGILCTGIAGSYIEFIVFYGLLSSLGMVMVMASFTLAVNTYFLKNRSKAVGYGMTLTGLGPIIMPFVISYFLSSYGVKWTVFLLSGLNLHSYIGALLLQPVKLHMKLQKNVPIEDKENKTLLPDVHSFFEMSAWESKMSLPTNSIDLSPKLQRARSRELTFVNNQEIIRERTKPRKLSLSHLDNDDYKNMMNSTLHMFEKMDFCEKNLKYASVESLECGKCLNDCENTTNWGLALSKSSSFFIAMVAMSQVRENLTPCTRAEQNPMEPLNPKLEGKNVDAGKQDSRASPKSEKAALFFKVIRFVGDIYDLDLFRDPVYLNVMFGLSVAFVGEVMFSTMTPIILKEMGFSTEETATFLSVIGGCDLLCRFIAPFAGKGMNLSSRSMYLISLCLLLLSRACFYMVSSYKSCLFIAVALGVVKGFRSVFWILVLPDYVPLSKLPSASAIQSLINGILLLLSGPLLGAITDLTKSYLSIIAASNVLTLTTIILWTGEIIYVKCKKKSPAATVATYT